MTREEAHTLKVDLIRREDAINQAQDGVVVKTQDTSIHLCKTRVVTVDRINELPTADRPTGEWKRLIEYMPKSDEGLITFDGYQCSVCGGKVCIGDFEFWDYCPNCGTQMCGQ